MSSDESSTIDVGTEFSQPNSPACGMTNPLGDMDIDEVPIEIVDDLIFSDDEESTEGLQITKSLSHHCFCTIPLQQRITELLHLNSVW